jgi:hypothetical protein
MRFGLAVRREGHVEHLLAAGAGEGVELELEPGAVLRAHVHRQGLGDGAEAARLLGAVHPHFEGHRPGVLLDVADEEGELAVRRLDHVGPGRVAVGHARAAGPAQAGEHRRRQALDDEAAVGIADAHVLRLFLLGAGGALDGEHAPSTLLGR